MYVQVAIYIYIYIHIDCHLHIHLPPPLTTTTQCKLPVCKCRFCTSGWLKEHHQRKLQRVTQTCASGLSALVAEWNSITSASCNWWQPPPIEAECLHQLKEWKHYKHKVQRSGCKVQSQAQNQCNYMLLQPPSPTSYDQHNTMEQSVQLACGPTIHSTNLALMQIALIAASRCVVHIWSVCICNVDVAVI